MTQRPLDAVLGSEANVRLLRLLTTDLPGPLNAEEAARRTGLTPPGARKGFERLVKTGFVRRAGAGPSQQFVLNESEPLVPMLAELFHAEKNRYEDLLKGLRESLGDIPEIRRAWIGRLPVGSDEAIEIALVSEPRDLPWIGEEARSRIASVERAFDQVVEVNTYTEADSPTPDPVEAIPLAGVIVKPQARGAARPGSHAEHDRRSLAVAEALAKLIEDDPSLVTRAKRYLDRQVHDGRGTASGDLLEWRRVLDTYSPERLRQFLVSTSSRAMRLRQSEPFLPVLTPEERERLARYLEDTE